METTRQPRASRGDGGKRFRVAIRLCLTMIVVLASGRFMAADSKRAWGKWQ